MRYVNIDEFLEVFDIPEERVGEWINNNTLQMYKEVRKDEKGNSKITGYRFGEPWRAEQLWIEGGFKTEGEALSRWYQEIQKNI